MISNQHIISTEETFIKNLIDLSKPMRVMIEQSALNLKMHDTGIKKV